MEEGQDVVLEKPELEEPPLLPPHPEECQKDEREPEPEPEDWVVEEMESQSRTRA